MNKLYTYLLTLILFFTFSSCQQELHFPEPEPVSLFTVDIDGTTYHLTVNRQVTYKGGDTAHVEIHANSPELSVHLISKSDKQTNGIGEYFLWCCNNDIFDRTDGTQKHWEMNRAGNGKQKGSVTVTRWDDKVLEGTYNMTGQVGTSRNAPVKSFTGTFTIFF